VKKEELIALLQDSQLPEFCITDAFVAQMLKKSNQEINAEISDSNKFWDGQSAQHRWRRC